MSICVDYSSMNICVDYSSMGICVDYSSMSICVDYLLLVMQGNKKVGCLFVFTIFSVCTTKVKMMLVAETCLLSLHFVHTASHHLQSHILSTWPLTSRRTTNSQRLQHCCVGGSPIHQQTPPIHCIILNFFHVTSKGYVGSRGDNVIYKTSYRHNPKSCGDNRPGYMATVGWYYIFTQSN